MFSNNFGKILILSYLQKVDGQLINITNYKTKI